MNCLLQDSPAEEAALLAVGGKSRAEQVEHFFCRERLDFCNRLAMNRFHEHRRRGLANDAACPIEEALLDFTFFVDLQLHPHYISAERILILVGMRRGGKFALVERIFVVVEHVLLVDFFFAGHGGAVGWGKLGDLSLV